MPEERTSLSLVLVPVDLEDESGAHIRAAIDLAARIGARVVLLHVYPLPPYVYPGIPPALLATIREQVATAARKSLDDLAARLGGVEALLREGDPATGILAAIEELHPGLVVMGTHGRRGLSRLFVGSVAAKVARSSTVPVMTVRETGGDAAKTAA